MTEQEDRPYISLGSGLRLFHEDWYIREFVGVDRTAFRRLCRALKVPMIHIGTRRFVEMTTFLLAMRSVSRIGQPDFVVKSSSYKHKTRESELNEDDFRENMQEVIAQLLVSRLALGGKLTKEVRTAARKAATLLAQAGMQMSPVLEQREYDRQALEKTREERTLP